MQEEPRDFPTIVEALKSPWTYFIFAILAMWTALENMHHLHFTLPLAFALSLMIKIDIKHMILPDSINLFLFALGLVAHTALYGNFMFSILGALFGFGLFFLIFYLTYKIKGEPSMGFGDVKFITALGAWVGFMGIPLILVWASFLAGIFIIFKTLVQKHYKNVPFAYGPFLAIAGWLSFHYTYQSWAVILDIRQQIIGLFS